MEVESQQIKQAYDKFINGIIADVIKQDPTASEAVVFSKVIYDEKIYFMHNGIPIGIITAAFNREDTKTITINFIFTPLSKPLQLPVAEVGD